MKKDQYRIRMGSWDAVSGRISNFRLYRRKRFLGLISYWAGTGLLANSSEVLKDMIESLPNAELV